MNELREHWANLRTATPSHRRVRLAALAGAALFALAFALAGAGGPVAWSGTVILGALIVYQPNGLMPVVFVLWAIGAWWAGVPQTWHWALLPAALGLLIVHAASALAASVPPQATLPGSVIRLYAGRVLLVAGATAVVWGVAGVLAQVSSRALGALPGIVGLALLVAALLGYAQLRRSGP